MHLSKKIYYQHVRNAVLDVCAKSVAVWAKEGKSEGYYGEKNYLAMSFAIYVSIFGPLSMNRTLQYEGDMCLDDKAAAECYFWNRQVEEKYLQGIFWRLMAIFCLIDLCREGRTKFGTRMHSGWRIQTDWEPWENSESDLFHFLSIWFPVKSRIFQSSGS